MRGLSTPSLSQGFCPAGRNPFGHPSDENGRGARPALRKRPGPLVGKRRAHNAHPYAKTEGDPRRGGFQPPEKPSPHRGEGVTAYAVTDEGSFYPRPCPRGVLSCGAEPLSGILRMKTGGGKTRPYVKTRAARGKRRARFARPLGSHRPPLFCQGRRDTLVGYARQFNTPAAAAQTGDGCRPPPAPDTGAMPKARVSRIGGPGWVWPGDLGEAVVTPDTLPRRRFACFAAGGKSSRPAGRNPRQIL